MNRHFLMSDIITRGASIAMREDELATYGTKDILKCYKVLDKGFDSSTGAPNYDRHIWYALTRMFLSVGAIDLSAIVVTCDESDLKSPLKWQFAFDLEGASDTFLKVTFFEEETPDIQPKDFPVKAMGSVDIAGYAARLGAYPMSVHPALRDRPPAAIVFFIASVLQHCGLLVNEIYHPEDTSTGYARYFLSDGITHCVIDFDGPHLVKALAIVDHQVGRTAEDGGLIDDLSKSSGIEEEQLDESSEDIKGRDDELREDNPSLPV